MNLITHIIKLRPLSSITHFHLHFFYTSSFKNTNYDKNLHQFSSKTQSFNLVPPNNIKNNKIYDVIYCNKLITKYIRSGDLESALKLFNEMPIKTIITWNSILAGFSRKPGTLDDARQLFDKMPERDLFSYNTMLSCYMRNNDVGGAKMLFEQMSVKDIASWNTMVSGFAGNGMMEEAEKLFWMIPVRNSVSWNVMISGYLEFGDLGSALRLFRLDPFKSVVAWTAIITGYMKIGDVEMAEKMYGEMPVKSCVTWNTMIAGYVENARPEDAVKLFKMMVESGVKPTPLTLTSVLLACSNLSALVFGKQIHQFVYKSPLYWDTPVGTSLLSMYCKCGVLQDAWKLFMEMPRKDIVTWNSMISGYATHGDKETALVLFDKMRNEKMKPDWITYVAVLSACNHAGLVDLGMRYFDSMRMDYGIEAKPEHYTCMVDLLGRAGKLKEAMDLIEKMPFKPHAAIFGSLLGSSRMHKNIEVAEFAANNLLSIDPTNAAAYVQLANVYATRGKWDHVSRVWRSMKDNKVVKMPGYSWIEIQNVIHEFRSSDREHPELASIHKKMSELQGKMKLMGYVPNLEYVLHDVENDQKEKLLLWHSEKLAIAYGLIKVPKGLPIRIFKNLRVCGDCHQAIKYISSIEEREIIVRDNCRFHHFRDGSCSCGDYW